MLALVLACMSCLILVAACDDSTDPGDEDDVTYIRADAALDDNGRLLDDLPEDLNYEGESIKVLYWSNVEHQEYEADEIIGENVNDAIYERNANIMDRLQVNLEWQGERGAWEYASSFVSLVKSTYQSGGKGWDIISCYTTTEGTLAVEGLLQDIKEIPNSYVDYGKPWWPVKMIETMTIGNSLYFVSGDVSTNTLHMMQCIYYNKTLISQRGMTDPSQHVYDGTWTVDKLIEMSSDTYEDKNTDGIANYQTDFFGFVSVAYHTSGLYVGANLRYVEPDPSNFLKLSSDYGSRRTVNLVKKLGPWMSSNDTMIHLDHQSSGKAAFTFEEPFVNNRALFILHRAHFAENRLTTTKLSYGILPCPKFDEKQVNYYTQLGNPASLYGLYAGFDKRDNVGDTLSMLSAVLECWASESYRLTTPEIFEVNMQLKYSATQTETDMFEYVRSNMTFDLGPIFSGSLGMAYLPMNAAMTGSSWNTAYLAVKQSLETKMNNMIDNLRNKAGLD